MRAPSKTHRQARGLRANMSLPEVLLWTRLRVRQGDTPVIRRQHPIGPYVLDFYCSERKLAIEIDGIVHTTGDWPRRDQLRDDYLRGMGIAVIRIAASEVLKDLDGVADGILDAARAPPQSSGPADPLTAPPLHGGAS